MSSDAIGALPPPLAAPPLLPGLVDPVAAAWSLESELRGYVTEVCLLLRGFCGGCVLVLGVAEMGVRGPIPHCAITTAFIVQDLLTLAGKSRRWPDHHLGHTTRLGIFPPLPSPSPPLPAHAYTHHAQTIASVSDRRC